MKTKSIKIIMWICISLLTVQFLAAGLSKFSGAWSDKFTNWGYSLMFMYVIGSLEITGVVGLFFPSTRKWSVLVLILLMMGAAYTHFSNSEYSRIIHNGVIAGLSIIVVQLNQKLRFP